MLPNFDMVQFVTYLAKFNRLISLDLHFDL